LMMFALTGAALMVGTVLCWLVRCPQCHTRLLWSAIRDQTIADSFPWLLTLVRCPVCGYEPNP
jgi:hypothetical protein